MKGMTLLFGVLLVLFIKFQSTYPMKGMTFRFPIRRESIQISIHIPYEGYDGFELDERYFEIAFQSTYPMKGMTAGCYTHDRKRFISIHIPYEGYDCILAKCQQFAIRISIHIPYEGYDMPLTEESEYFARISIHIPYEGYD